MPQSLSQRAHLARKQLFERYDELNALWIEAETELTKLHIPHEITFVYQSWDESQYDCIGMQKLKGQWRICHGTCSDVEEREVEDWMPITECSALVRTLAAHHIVSLHKAIVALSEKFIPRVDKAIESLRNGIRQLRHGDLPELLAERAKLNGKPGSES